jgi:signal transduction histidine kinase
VKFLDLVHELRTVLGSASQISFSGPVHKVTDQSEEVLAIFRELLTNVGKHARQPGGDHDRRRQELRDSDGDGDGMGDVTRAGHGLKNLCRRAQRLGGSVELGTSRERGTRPTWHLPLGSIQACAGPTV